MKCPVHTLGPHHEADDKDGQQVREERGPWTLQAHPVVHGWPQNQGVSEPNRPRSGGQRLDLRGTEGRDLHSTLQADDKKSQGVSDILIIYWIIVLLTW